MDKLKFRKGCQLRRDPRTWSVVGPRKASGIRASSDPGVCRRPSTAHKIEVAPQQPLPSSHGAPDPIAGRLRNGSLFQPQLPCAHQSAFLHPGSRHGGQERHANSKRYSSTRGQRHANGGVDAGQVCSQQKKRGSETAVKSSGPANCSILYRPWRGNLGRVPSILIRAFGRLCLLPNAQL